jgi:hypothetical protein
MGGEMSYLIRWSLFFKAAGMVIILLIFRLIIDYFHIDILPEMNLISCFIGGTLFVVALILASVLSDYKEAEKISDDLPTTLTSLFISCGYIQKGDHKIVRDMKVNIVELLSEINADFKNNKWNNEVHQSKIYAITDLLELMSINKVDPQFVTAFHSELSNIMRTLNRIDTIINSKFSLGIYLASYVAVGVSMLLLLFAQITSNLQSLVMVGSISFVFIVLLLLIDDMENPFETGRNALVDVDLSHLFKLEQNLKKLMEKSS